MDRFRNIGPRIGNWRMADNCVAYGRDDIRQSDADMNLSGPPRQFNNISWIEKVRTILGKRHAIDLRLIDIS